jgi:DNA mismatch repair protein MSH3
MALIHASGVKPLNADRVAFSIWGITRVNSYVAPMMAPSTANAGKKQQSISSFFTKSSPVRPVDPPPSGQARKPSLPRDSTPGSDGGDIYSASDDDLPKARRRRSRTPKRPLAEDPDAINNQPTDRSSKRLKVNDAANLHEQLPHHAAPVTANEKATQKSKITPRTERYVYTGSSQNGTASASAGEGEQDSEAVLSQKEELHRRFVKKLGHPDSIAQIKRRNWQITEETAQLDEDGAGDEEEEEEAPKPTKKKGAKTGKLTPMEIQMLDIKRKHMDAILIVEVGYKLKFFGEDARIAAKELGIVCIPGKMRFDEHPSEAHLDRFASASIPVHRLPVHAKRLVMAGHKVGVVRQIETAALKKAGDNRNTPFIRKLTNLYTKGTYIDDIDGLDQSAPAGGAPASGYLLCITETKANGWGTDEKVDVGILAVQPATGDVIYDNFEDGFMRSEIETRLLHISPCEFLIVGELTKATEKLVQHLSGSTTNVFGDKIRVERVSKPKTAAAESHSHVAQFYAQKLKAHEGASTDKASNLLDKVLTLSEPVTICLSAMIKHMTEYGLEHVFDLTKYFQSFSARTHMLLNGNTLTSLELYHNQTDHTEKGSLFWALDRTQTRFGQRLLRKWVGRPLVDKEKLEERVAAVEELKENTASVNVDRLKSLLMKVKSDLEKSLIRIYYGKCTRPELLTVLQTMQRIANEFAHVKSPANAGFKSSMLNEAVANLPRIGDVVVGFLDKMNLEAAKSDDKYAFFRETEETDEITNHKLGIASVEHDLNEHRAVAGDKIKRKKVDYVSVAGIEYLIEVDNTALKNVPASWSKISGTKKLSRFHTPEVIRMIRERDQHKEALAAACDIAFSNLLSEIAGHYQSFRDCVSSLATLDCLLSLAAIAAQPGYVKPEFTTENEISIIGGRHPMVEQLLLSEYIPNDTHLSNEEGGTRALLITGPNMGGKSSYVRHIALICIMSQIGSYVPASSCRLSPRDAIFTRMGAADNMLAGESTFMVELSETSDILKQATPKSLVILDELGRGTSTHDGVAIAGSVLEYVTRETRCLTLFITHYQTLAALERAFPGGELRNVHMAFREEGTGEGAGGTPDITFLFQVAPGVAHRSYGLNVARLARVPDSVLAVAARKSAEMEREQRRRRAVALWRGVGRLVEGKESGGDGDGEGGRELLKREVEALVAGIETL